MKLLKKREEKSKSGLKKRKWGRWGTPQINCKILGIRNLERGVVL